MLNAVRPLLNETVEHWLSEPVLDRFGVATDWESTRHGAKVDLNPGSFLAKASGERIGDAKARIYLLNHPRAVELGDTFTLPGGQHLQVKRVEQRRSSAGTLTRAYL